MKLICLVLSLCFLGDLALGEEFKKKKRRKKKKKNTVQEVVKELPWLPDWSVPGFDWSFDPIFGFRARSTEVNGVKTTTAASEGGAHLGFYNISINPGTPAIQLSPHAGIAWGYLAQDTDSADANVELKSPYTRNWYGLDLTVYHKFYRHQLGFHAGSINYDEDFDKIQNETLINDMGIMILPHISGHLTSTFQTVFNDSRSRPLLEEWDHWLHSRISFETFSLGLDFGPGTTNIDQFSIVDGTHSKASSSSSTYLLSKLSANFFWKFGLWGSMKYIVAADESLVGSSTVIEQLPNQGLNDPTSVQSLPEDSLDTYFFVGIQNLIGGFGFGYRYSMLVLNYGEKNGTDRQVYRDSGYTVMYTLSL